MFNLFKCRLVDLQEKVQKTYAKIKMNFSKGILFFENFTFLCHFWYYDAQMADVPAIDTRSTIASYIIAFPSVWVLGYMVNYADIRRSSVDRAAVVVPP